MTIAKSASRKGWLPAVGLAAMLLVVPTSIAAGQKSLLADPGSGPSPPVTPDPVAGPDPQIHMAYFSKVGCSVCDEVEGHLDEAQRLYPQLVVTEFPIEDESSKVLSEWLGQRFGVPEEKRMTTPSVFVGQHYLVGTDQVVPKNLQAVLDRYVDSGTEPTWTTYDSARSEASIFARFRSFGAFTVAGAGLIDGLNPCAFATIVFFVSYLAFLDRKGREVLAVGGAFALGVFVTYLLVGLGMLRVLEQLAFLSALRPWVYGLTAALCLVLAAYSFLDYRKARGGDLGEMALRIPRRLRQRINSTVRRGAKAEAIVPVALATGFVISLLELACTGQVYLPTIIFVMARPEMQGRAFLYLLLYNAAFILPLVVVFGLAYFGTTSRQLGRFINRRTAAIKLGTALVFVVLAGWMLSSFV